MDEAKVREALKAAKEAANEVGDDLRQTAFARVFDAVLYDPQPRPLTTATGKRKQPSKRKAVGKLRNNSQR